jgi:hypothetical protein
MPAGMSTDLFGTESTDPIDQNICPRDAVKMSESDKGVERSRYFYEPKSLDAEKRVYAANAEEKQRLEEQQLALYETGE